ncbi:MAG: 16S rRNA (cytosine(967)-C(5))-methyltransferase RsmB [Oscillospiraceae bacterium]|nr:16S rRNA (cytosine(967)-C(5))-methyltransferase RsmB [Oscillospiraceae bacterium]
MDEKKLNAREACLESLVNYEKSKKYSNIELGAALEKYCFCDLDRAFITKLFYGVIEKKLTLDYIIYGICDKNAKIDLKILNILRMGIYQLSFMDKIPESAACDESVKLAKRANPQNLKIGGFVNAVLRAFLRNKEGQFENIEKIKGSCKYFEIKYSCSCDIIKIWTESYGSEISEKLLCESQKKRGLAITANTLKISRDSYLEKLAAIHEGMETKKTEISPYGIIIEGEIPIKNIYGFDEGLFFVQDEASQICAHKTGAKPGDLVIDCCAAPGGKSFYMAQMMKNKGKIMCFDIYENKLGLMEKSAKRFGIDIIETRKHDFRTVFGEPGGIKADVVLCDVPCSGLGTITKKPEIKYKTIDEISKMPKIQHEILRAGSNHVKPGGTLIYSTCTLNKKENEEVACKFAGENESFKIEYTETLFPFKQKTDGFFIAKMKRCGL